MSKPFSPKFAQSSFNDVRTVLARHAKILTKHCVVTDCICQMFKMVFTDTEILQNHQINLTMCAIKTSIIIPAYTLTLSMYDCMSAYPEFCSLWQHL